jgi:hypothetical protein
VGGGGGKKRWRTGRGVMRVVEVEEGDLRERKEQER